jgi:hypothetical protein
MLSGMAKNTNKKKKEKSKKKKKQPVKVGDMPWHSKDEQRTTSSKAANKSR